MIDINYMLRMDKVKKYLQGSIHGLDILILNSVHCKKMLALQFLLKCHHLNYSLETSILVDINQKADKV